MVMGATYILALVVYDSLRNMSVPNQVPKIYISIQYSGTYCLCLRI